MNLKGMSTKSFTRSNVQLNLNKHNVQEFPQQKQQCSEARDLGLNTVEDQLSKDEKYQGKEGENLGGFDTTHRRRFRAIRAQVDFDEKNISAESGKLVLHRQIEKWSQGMFGLADQEHFNKPLQEYHRRQKQAIMPINQLEQIPNQSQNLDGDTHPGSPSSQQHNIFMHQNSNKDDTGKHQTKQIPTGIESKPIRKPSKRSINKNFVRLTLVDNNEVVDGQLCQDQKKIVELRKNKNKQREHANQQKSEQVDSLKGSLDEDGSTIPMKRKKLNRKTTILKPWISLRSPEGSTNKKKIDYSFKALKLKVPKNQFFDLESVKVEAPTLQNEEVLNYAKNSIPSSYSRLTLVQKLNQSRITISKSKRAVLNHPNRQQELQNCIIYEFHKSNNKNVSLSRLDQKSVESVREDQGQQSGLNNRSNQQLRGNFSQPVSRQRPAKKSQFLPYIVLNGKCKIKNGVPTQSRFASAESSLYNKQPISTLDRSGSLLTSNRGANIFDQMKDNSFLEKKSQGGYYKSYEKRKIKQSLSGILDINVQ